MDSGRGRVERVNHVDPEPPDWLLQRPIREGNCSLLVTIDAPGEDFEDFFPIAEEILAGISFPDLG